MGIYAIVCEYNPFHNGHRYQIQEIRASDLDARIVCIMSGNFVQRGDVAVMDKYVRAEMAVKAGADLVLELPFPWCMAPAEIFSRAAMQLIDSLGNVDFLHFGSESADAAMLFRVASNMQKDIFLSEVKSLRTKEPSLRYADILRRAYTSLFGNEDEAVFQGSNDILALEYIKALIRMNLPIQAKCIQRTGNLYNDEHWAGAFPSASAIRKTLLADQKQVAPSEKSEFEAHCAEFYGKHEIFSLESLSTAILAFFRLHDERKTDEIFGMNPARAKRIFRAASCSCTLSDLIASACSKTDSASGIRRALLSDMLNVSKDSMNEAPAFSLMLAASSQGTYLLKKISPKIKIITKPADYRFCDERVKRQFECEMRAESLFALASTQKRPGFSCLQKTPYIQSDRCHVNS